MPAHKTRTDEEQEIETTREDETREVLDWLPPSLLEAPPAREGFRQRWVATSILGKDIPHHTMRRIREGWAPRPADTVPSDWPVPTITHGQYEGYIGVEGMILCEMSEARVSKRTEYFKGKVTDQDHFVDAALNNMERQSGLAVQREQARSVKRGNRRQGVADD